MERSRSDLACHTAAMILGTCHHPSLHPGIPEWPKNTVESCRTVKELAHGPYKDKRGKNNTLALEHVWY